MPPVQASTLLLHHKAAVHDLAEVVGGADRRFAEDVTVGGFDDAVLVLGLGEPVFADRLVALALALQAGGAKAGQVVLTQHQRPGLVLALQVDPLPASSLLKVLLPAIAALGFLVHGSS